MRGFLSLSLLSLSLSLSYSLYSLSLTFPFTILYFTCSLIFFLVPCTLLFCIFLPTTTLAPAPNSGPCSPLCSKRKTRVWAIDNFPLYPMYMYIYVYTRICINMYLAVTMVVLIFAFYPGSHLPSITTCSMDFLFVPVAPGHCLPSTSRHAVLIAPFLPIHVNALLPSELDPVVWPAFYLVPSIIHHPKSWSYAFPKYCLLVLYCHLLT